MGLLDDAGIIVDGRVSVDVFFAYINDVKRKLKTGKGTFKSPELDDFTDPVPPYQAVALENWNTFADFHRVWNERYSKMLSILNLPGQYRLAAQGVPIIDPTAMAKTLGSKEKIDAKMPNILYEMQGLPPPGEINPPPTIEKVQAELAGGGPQIKTVEYFDKYLKGVDPFDPQVITKLVTALSAPETPAKERFTRPQFFPYGFDRRRDYEKVFYENVKLIHVMMMSTATLLLPPALSELSSGAGCNNLFKAIYTPLKVESQKLNIMKTSLLEQAATEVLLQHQVKLHSAILFGMNLGSGAVLSALLYTPENAGGLGLVDPKRTYESVITSEGSKIKSNTEESQQSTQEAAQKGVTTGETTQNSNQNLEGSGAAMYPGQQQNAVGGAGTEGAGAPPGQPTTLMNGQSDGTGNPPQIDESNRNDSTETANIQSPAGSSAIEGQRPPKPPADGTGDYYWDNDAGEWVYESTSGVNRTTVQEDTTPADIGPRQDYSQVYIPEPQHAKDNDEKENDGENTGVDKNLSPLRQRARDLLEGGPTCKGAIGPIPFPVDTPREEGSNNGIGSMGIIKGYKAGQVDPEWGQVIQGAQGIIGGGWTTKQEVADMFSGANPENQLQAIKTSCGQLGGWFLCNLVFDPSHPYGQQNLTFPVNSDSDKITYAAGFPYTHQMFGSLKSVTVGMPGVGGLGYYAALLGAWQNASPIPRNPTSIGGEMITPTPGNMDVTPKYGDVYFHRDDDPAGTGNMRHVGIILHWNPAGGYVVHADAGKSTTNQAYRAAKEKGENLDASLAAASAWEGMGYGKSKLEKTDKGWKTSPPAGSGKDVRYIMGWINIEALIVGIKKQFGNRYTPPDWAK